MQTLEAKQHAAAFHCLHNEPEPLILVNAWDAGSARILEHAGAPAIATTSAGMAWSLGYRDGEQLPTSDLIAGAARICRAVSVPVTVDIERGFGRDTDDVVTLVQTLVGLGVAGVNIEDGVVPDTGQLAAPEILCERIIAVREMATRMNATLFINARTDTYFVASDDRAARYDETVRRAQLYASAGADGIFVPGMDLNDIAPFTGAIALPVNVYAGVEGAPPVPVLRDAGARRVSLGCGPLQCAYGSLRAVAREAFAEGSYDGMNAYMLSFGEVNELF